MLVTGVSTPEWSSNRGHFIIRKRVAQKLAAPAVRRLASKAGG